MKTLLTTAALAVVIATPALSQTVPQRNDRAFDPYAYASAPDPYARAYNQQRRFQQGSTINRSDSVYDTSGKYIGSDPDPRVRAQLSNDPSQGD
jgi:hypothetical protein